MVLHDIEYELSQSSSKAPNKNQIFRFFQTFWMHKIPLKMEANYLNASRIFIIIGPKISLNPKVHNSCHRKTN